MIHIDPAVVITAVVGPLLTGGGLQIFSFVTKRRSDRAQSNLQEAQQKKTNIEAQDIIIQDLLDYNDYLKTENATYKALIDKNIEVTGKAVDALYAKRARPETRRSRSYGRNDQS